MRQRLALSLLVAMLGCTFAALAVWQVERRAWKHALIARVEQRVQAVAIDAPGPDRWPRVDAVDDAYTHVRLRGAFIAGHDTFVQATTVFGSGYWMLTPLRRDDGTTVLVNRGFVSGDDRARVREAAAQDAGPRIVSGLLRVTEPGGSLLRRNDPAAERWISRDVEAIAKARGLQRVAPYFVDADAQPGAGPPVDAPVDVTRPRTRPIGGLTVVAFSDNHLLYAIVWSTLAGLCIAALVLLRRPARKTP